MRYLPLTRGLRAIVSDVDYSWTSKVKWHPTKKDKYVSRVVQRSGKSVRIYLHRQITKAKANEEVHHRNGNGLDCRRRNLKRLGPKTHRQTFWPSKPRCRGVGQRSDTGRWRAYIQVNLKDINLGCFDSARAAAKAYNVAARKHWGKHAHQNRL